MIHPETIALSLTSAWIYVYVLDLVPLAVSNAGALCPAIANSEISGGGSHVSKLEVLLAAAIGGIDQIIV